MLVYSLSAMGIGWLAISAVRRFEPNRAPEFLLVGGRSRAYSGVIRHWPNVRPQVLAANFRNGQEATRVEDKPEASKHFSTPLLFSIHEAKGLEYENIVLYRFVSNHRVFHRIGI